MPAHARYLGLLFLSLALGCLEPGPTPMGPDVVQTPIPEDAIHYCVTGADSLGLNVMDWEEPIPLFETSMLFCGFDEESDFRAEPLWVFDSDQFAAYDGSVSLAWLQLGFPDARLDSLEGGDNPDIERDVRVRLWRLPDQPDENEPLASPLDLNGATQVPLITSLREEDYSPFRLELSGEGFALPPDMVRDWIEEGETLTLALEWVDPAVEGVGENGMIRVFARGSTAPDDVTTTAAVLKIEDGSGTRYSTEASVDGLAVGRQDGGLIRAQALCLATGLPRSAHISLALPDTLRDTRLIVIRARLALYPDSSLLFGMSPDDRQDNLVGGGNLPAKEGGLTLHLLAADDSLPGSAGLEEGVVLAEELNVFEENYIYDADEITLSRSRLREPLYLPLTHWIQDWANGEDENFGLTLKLNAEGERLRQVGWQLEPDSPALRPSLEILYVWRPDFE